MQIKTVINKLSSAYDLTQKEAYDVVAAIAADELTDVQIAGFQVALKMKGPTVTEITGLAQGLRDQCTPIKPKVSGPLLDTCGTGGGETTFNVSTANSLMAAAGGISVAKHGSRSIASHSGSADVLEALGVNIELAPAQSEQLIEEIGIAFLNAQNFHPVMGRVWTPESQLGIKTIFFTIMGPLISPADAKRHVMGVFKPELVELMAEILAKLEFEHALVVHGLDNLDEISLLGKTSVAEVKDGRISKYELTPEQLGLDRCSLEDIGGGMPDYNAQLIRDVFSGKERGPKRSMVVLNAAGALYVGGKAASLEQGVELAQAIIDSGAASKKLDELIEASNQIGE